VTLKWKKVSPASVSLAAALILAAWWPLSVRFIVTAQTPPNGGMRRSAAPASSADRLIGQHAQQMIDQGRRTFRYDTFGSEAFWATRCSCTEPLRARRMAASAEASARRRRCRLA